MKKLWQSLLTSSAMFAVIANFGTAAIAEEISTATESQIKSAKQETINCTSYLRISIIRRTTYGLGISSTTILGRTLWMYSRLPQ